MQKFLSLIIAVLIFTFAAGLIYAGHAAADDVNMEEILHDASQRVAISDLNNQQNSESATQKSTWPWYYYVVIGLFLLIIATAVISGREGIELIIGLLFIAGVIYGIYELTGWTGVVVGVGLLVVFISIYG